MVVTCPERGPASRRHKNGLRRLPAPPAIVNRVRTPGGGCSAPPPHRLDCLPPASARKRPPLRWRTATTDLPPRRLRRGGPFARQLQGQVEQRLAGDDAKARHFQDYLTKRSQESDASPLTVVLRTWILADGQVHRVEFDGIDDRGAVDDLRALLVDGNVGAPPPEMLQPLHLRLSLRARDPSRQGE